MADVVHNLAAHSALVQKVFTIAARVDIVVMVGNMVCFSKVQMDQNGIVPHWIKFRVDVDRCLKAAFAIAQTQITIAARLDIVVMVGKMVGISKVQMDQNGIVPHWIKFRVDVDRCLKAAFAIAQTQLTIAARLDIVVMVG